MDKMREEFEGWSVNCDLCTFTVGDEYKYMATEWAWRAWKASRAALCVELPNTDDFGDDQVLFDFEGAVQTSLDEAGVTYK